jgi:ribosome-binding protein aMBF1 (putative translation factor)
MATVRCELCGRYGKLDVHHVFEGRNRKNSDKYGAVIRVCRTCHDNIHHYPRTYEHLKREWQQKLMERYGWTEDEFREIFKRSYL